MRPASVYKGVKEFLVYVTKVIVLCREHAGYREIHGQVACMCLLASFSSQNLLVSLFRGCTVELFFTFFNGNLFYISSPFCSISFHFILYLFIEILFRSYTEELDCPGFLFQ